jgi:hypothetical protein
MTEVGMTTDRKPLGGNFHLSGWDNFDRGSKRTKSRALQEGKHDPEIFLTWAGIWTLPSPIYENAFVSMIGTRSKRTPSYPL